LILLVLRQYIGAANLLAPIYWRCKHLKKSAKFLTLLVMPSQVAPIDWCYEHHSTNILVLPAQVAPIYWCYDVRSTNILVLFELAAPISPYRFVYHVVKCTVFGGFFHYCE
jgi:hypothetical protein